MAGVSKICSHLFKPPQLTHYKTFNNYTVVFSLEVICIYIYTRRNFFLAQLSSKIFLPLINWCILTLWLLESDNWLYFSNLMNFKHFYVVIENIFQKRHRVNSWNLFVRDYSLSSTCIWSKGRRWRCEDSRGPAQKSYICPAKDWSSLIYIIWVNLYIILWCKH